MGTGKLASGGFWNQRPTTHVAPVRLEEWIWEAAELIPVELIRSYAEKDYSIYTKSNNWV